MADAVDVPGKVTPLEAGEPVEALSLHTQGGTFAERKAAREGSKAVESDSAENKSVSAKKTVKK